MKTNRCCARLIPGSAVDQGRVNAASLHARRAGANSRHLGMEEVVVWVATSAAGQWSTGQSNTAFILDAQWVW